MTDWQIEAAGPQAIMIRFGTIIDPTLTPLIRAASDTLAKQLNGQIIDLVPSYTTLMVVYDVLQHDFASIRSAIVSALHDLNVENGHCQLVEIPVFYDLTVGNDLQRVADYHQISIDDVISRHSQTIYQVYAIGFAPGFAYLGNVADNLATPRLDKPRLKVPTGSVAIADQQTAVYPLETPGGWNIIGRTYLPMLDRQLLGLCPLNVGDSVQFTPISREEFVANGGEL
ncbi:MAG: 5-oxoprolinase subunit PxpB [Methylophaga sp.]|nr:5-oxoprolinase subunit PxpB [Methylophaga sp.]